MSIPMADLIAALDEVDREGILARPAAPWILRVLLLDHLRDEEELQGHVRARAVRAGELHPEHFVIDADTQFLAEQGLIVRIKGFIVLTETGVVIAQDFTPVNVRWG